VAAKRTVLGRGFEALIPKDLDRSILDEDKTRVQELLITDITPNPDQPRNNIGKDLKELISSVKKHGVIQPIIVVRRGNGYRLVAGERRWRAAASAGHKNIPAIVRSLEALEAGKISEGHARAVLALKGIPDKQSELLSCVLNNGWTVRQAEQFVVGAKKGASLDQAKGRTASESTLTKSLAKKLGRDVKIKHTARGGQLIIHFSNDKDLEKLSQQLQSKD